MHFICNTSIAEYNLNHLYVDLGWSASSTGKSLSVENDSAGEFGLSSAPSVWGMSLSVLLLLLLLLRGLLLVPPAASGRETTLSCLLDLVTLAVVCCIGCMVGWLTAGCAAAAA